MNKHVDLDELAEIDRELAGEVDDQTIFRLQAEYYNEKIRKPLLRHGEKCDRLTARDCEKHFKKHSVNPKRMLANDIKTIDALQSFLASRQMMKTNLCTGKSKVNFDVLKHWSLLCKQKLDLLRFYHSDFETRKEKRQKTDQHSFNDI